MRPPSDARRVWCGAFGAALLLFAFTASPYPQWQDSGWQQIRILTHQLHHPLGLALIHPLHHFLGRAAIACLPFLEPAYAITLVSAVAAAIAIANIAALILLLTGAGGAALISAASLAVAHTFWQLATHTESYTLFAALFTAEWLCLARYVRTGRTDALMALACINGLGFANHVLAALALPINAAALYFATAGRRGALRTWIAAACWWTLGAMPYLAIIAARMAHTGEVMAVLRSAFFGEFREQVLNTRVSASMLARAGGFVVYNFPNLTLPFAAAAFFTGRAPASSADPAERRALVYFVRFLAVELLVYGLFVIRYAIADQYTFFIPVYCIVAALAGMGLARLAPRWRARALVAGLVLILVTPGLYWATAKILSSRHTLDPMLQGKPLRDGYRSLLVPWGIGDDHTVRLNRAALDLAGHNGVILFVDPMIGFSLQYDYLLGKWPKHVRLVDIATPTPARQTFLRNLIRSARTAGRAVVLVPSQRDRAETFLHEARWRREGDLFMLEALDGP